MESKYKLRFKTKPWITPGLQKSISNKNKLLTKYIKMKDHKNKLEMAEIISSLEKNKSVGSYSIPNNIFILKYVDSGIQFDNKQQ